MRRFELLAEALPQIVWICGADGHNVFFNQKWVEYTGLSLEESHGAGWNKPFHPADQQRSWEAWDDAVHQRGTYSLECRLRRKDGEYRWWLVRGVPSFADDGSIDAWFGTCTDIHDTKVAADELARRERTRAEIAEDSLQLAIEGADMGVWQWHIAEDRLVWSDRAKALVGLSLDAEMSYSRWVACLHPEDRSRAEADLAQAIAQGELFEAEYRVVWPDDSIHWLQCVGRAIYEGAEAIRVAGVLLRSRTSESRLVAEAIPQMLWIAEDSKVTYFNQQWLDYSGTLLESQVGYGWIDTTHPDDQEGLQRAVLAAADPASTSFEQHYRLRRSDGAYRWCIGRGKKMKLSSGGKALWYGTTIDVHDLHDALEAAQTANRAKATFLATTSHELRTPLNAIIGFSTLLLAGDLGPLLDSQKKPMEIVKSSGEQLLMLVQDILDFTAIEAGKFRMDISPTPLKGLLGDVRNQLLPRALERSLDLLTGECVADLRVMVDPARLGQAVRNLVSNGLTYTDRGYVKISAVVEDEFARIDVTDSGIGIPSTELHKVFQAFQPIQREDGKVRQGTGLGLAITRRIVEAMGGVVGCSSEPGTGSRFWIKVPLAA